MSGREAGQAGSLAAREAGGSGLSTASSAAAATAGTGSAIDAAVPVDPTGAAGRAIEGRPGVAGAGPADAGVGPTEQDGDGATEPDVRSVELPPSNAGFDYQVGDIYPPPDLVVIVAREHTKAPVQGRYNICEIDGFETREEDRDFWSTQHSDLILRDVLGIPIVDPEAGMLLDVSTEAKRMAVAAIVAEWIAGCAAAGFDAVAIDNLDSYTRSGGRLLAQHAIDTMALFSAAAHAHQLAVAQRNASELVVQKAALGTDFAIAEECNRYRECEDYRAGYGDHVLLIEYRRADFETGCSAYPQLSIVLRDAMLSMPADATYQYDGC